MQCFWKQMCRYAVVARAYRHKNTVEILAVTTSCWFYRSISTVSLFCTIRDIIHRVSKTSRLWLVITLTHMNKFSYFFGRNVTDKVSNQKTLYCTTPNNLCFCTTWQNGETWKLHFSLKCYISRECCSNWTVLSSWKKNCHLWCVW